MIGLAMAALAADPHVMDPSSDGPRPFYLIKHCANSLRRLAKAQSTGANAVEVDLQWRQGALYIGHPAPNPTACLFAHAKGQDLGEYFRQLGEQIRGDRLQLVILDIKAPAGAGDAYPAALAKVLAEAGVPPDRVVLSVPHDQARRFTATVRDAGFAVGHVDAWFDGALPAGWLDVSIGEGSCFLGVGADPVVFWRPTSTFRPALEEMIARRDTGGSLHSVYFWTLARRSSFRTAVDLGVDGIIVNNPRHFLPVMDEYRRRSVLAAP